jgi:putative PIN family toxin of toxin-antitoxin system
MQKIIIDTNVFVSSLIQRSYPYYIVSEVFSNRRIKLCISEELMEEYINVLNRDKFSKFQDFAANAKVLLKDIERIAAIFSPSTKFNIIKDVDDNKLLELSYCAKADFLITGNTNDFTMKEFKKTKIVSPAEYWSTYMPI